MRTFGQVPIKIWRNKKFRSLSDDAKLVFLSLWCGPQSTSAGVMMFDDGHAALDMGWTLDRWKSARKEVEQAGLIKCNEATEEVLIWNFFAVNRPANDRARSAVLNQIEAIECESLAQEAMTAFEAVLPAPKPAIRAVNNLNTAYLNRNQGTG